MCSVFWDAKTWSTQSPWNLQEGRPTGSSKAWTIILWSISWFHKVWGWCILFILMLFCYSIQAGSLSDFYENCRGLELARNFQFPTLREVRDWPLLNCFTFIRYLSWENIFFFSSQPPQTFLVTMEEYVREAPRMVPVRETLVSTCTFLCFIYYFSDQAV